MTNAEAAFQTAVRELGCIICLRTMGLRSDCDIHHILRGGRRIGEMDVLGLCPSHHRAGLKTGPIISRHPFKTRFEGQYGSEASLLAWTRERIAEAQRMAA